MRGCLFGTSATILSILVASCQFPTSQAASCNDDPELCPKSSKEATSVICDCRCTIGVTEDTGQSFDGHVAVCLPPALNATVASADQQQKLQAVEPHVFDQRVFQFCSREVASFMRASIRVPARLVLACAVPIKCECTTNGTTTNTDLCREPCKDITCDAKNCGSVLRRDSKIDLTSCFCSRASTCGNVTPTSDNPALCRDWTRPLPPDAK